MEGLEEALWENKLPLVVLGDWNSEEGRAASDGGRWSQISTILSGHCLKDIKKNSKLKNIRALGDIPDGVPGVHRIICGRRMTTIGRILKHTGVNFTRRIITWLKVI